MFLTHVLHWKVVSCLFISLSLSESLSEAVKILKVEYLVTAINEHKMDQAIIFCRTKLDCDNVEEYLVSLGGGKIRKKYYRSFQWLEYACTIPNYDLTLSLPEYLMKFCTVTLTFKSADEIL